jgi:hypothetical protein
VEHVTRTTRSFQDAFQEQLEVVGLPSFLPRQDFRDLACRLSIDQVNCDQDDQFRFAFGHRLGAEQRPDEWKLPQHWELVGRRRAVFGDQPTDHETLSTFQFHCRMNTLRVSAWYSRTRDHHARRCVQRTHFWLHFQVDAAIAQDYRQTAQTCAKLLELDTDLTQARRNRDGLFATFEESCWRAAEGHNARLREQFRDTFDLQSLQKAQETSCIADHATKQG